MTLGHAIQSATSRGGLLAALICCSVYERFEMTQICLTKIDFLEADREDLGT
jgi:hypothetical protein